MKRGINVKAQISVFIIISIIVIVSIIIFFIIKNKIYNDEKQKIPYEIAPIYSFVENCIKDTGEDSIFFIGQTGGYFVNPKESTSEYGVSYYLYNNENIMPSKERIEKEVGNYVDNMIDFCVGDFNEFSEFKISKGKANTETKINNGKVIFNVIFPLSITKNQNTYSLKEFKGIEVPVRLDKVYDIASQMMKEQMSNKDKICIGCITDLAVERDLYVQMTRHDDNQTVVFTIIDKNSKIKGNDYWFSFANKYR